MESDDYPSSILTWITFQGIVLYALIAHVITFFIVLFTGMLNAFGVATLSLSEEDKQKLAADDSSSAALLKHFINKPDSLRLTIRLCKVFLNALLTLFFAYGFLVLVSDSLPFWLTVLLLLVSVFLLLFLSEELLPRILIRNRALSFSLRYAPMMSAIEKVFRPFTQLLLNTSDRIYKNISVRKSDFSMDGLGKAFALSSDNTNEDKEMIADIIRFYGKTANEIMTPRLDMADIEIKSTFRQVIDFIVESGYSRIPVYLETEDNIKGILYIKDLLPHLEKPEAFRWQSMIRPAYFVPETKKIDDLLEEFRTKKIHMAIVVDEFGGTSGLVTMEDILEEIVGDISDEYDDDERLYIPQADGSIIFEAKIPLTDFYRLAEVEKTIFGKYTEESETLAGLLLEIKGDMPKRTEVIEYAGCVFRILEADTRRILKVKFSKETETSESMSEES